MYFSCLFLFFTEGVLFKHNERHNFHFFPTFTL
jgi:hypothetical protein